MDGFDSADGQKPLVNQEPAPAVNQDTSSSKPGASTPGSQGTAPSTLPPSGTSAPPPSNTSTTPPSSTGSPVLTCASVLCAPGTYCIDSGKGAQCISRDPCQGFVCPKGEHCSAPADAPLCVPDEEDPCASVTCQQGEQCVVQQVVCIQAPCPGIPSCVATDCRRTGCSSQICSDQDVGSTCEYRPEYACFEKAKCERQPTGECGFTPNDALKICLANAGSSASE